MKPRSPGDRQDRCFEARFELVTVGNASETADDRRWPLADDWKGRECINLLGDMVSSTNRILETGKRKRGL